MTENAAVLSYRWRTDSSHDDPDQWKPGSLIWAENETLGMVRSRIIESFNELDKNIDCVRANDHPPELWLCDKNGTLHAKGDVDLLWTPATAVNDDDARLLFDKPWARRNKPKAFILFTFPLKAEAVQTPTTNMEELMIKVARVVLREQAQDTKSTATLSEVADTVLQERVLRLLNITLHVIETEAGVARRPSNYVAFEWTDAHELRHEEGEQFVNGGYLRHVRLMLNLNVPYTSPNARAAVVCNVTVSGRPGSFKNLHGKMDLAVAQTHMGRRSQIDTSVIQYHSFIGIELKKTENLCTDSFVQARATLLALDDVVVDHFVLVVLTDLVDHWTLFWLASDPKPYHTGPRLCQYQCSPATALRMIDDFVNYYVQVLRVGVAAVPIPESFPARKFFKLASLPPVRRPLIMANHVVAAAPPGPSPPGPSPPRKDENAHEPKSREDGAGGASSSKSGRGSRSRRRRRRGGNKGPSNTNANDHDHHHELKHSSEDDIVVNGMTLNPTQRKEWEGYVFRKALLRSPAFRDCDLIVTPPAFLLEQEL